MLHQLMDPRGEYLEHYRCADGCQKLNTSTKAVYATQLSDALIIQLNIFKYSDVISKKVVPLPDINYHEGEQFHCGNYTSGVKERKFIFWSMMQKI